MSERMAGWLRGVDEEISLPVDEDIKTIFKIVAGITLLSLAGATSKLGLTRAIFLGWKSYFTCATFNSVRTSEVKKMKEIVDNLCRGSYLAVTGERGIGKTCLINTALQRQCGVLNLKIDPFSKKSIVEQVLRSFTGIKSPLVCPSGTANRMLFFYKLFFKKSFILVLQLSRKHNSFKPDISTLKDNYAFSVIVDSYTYHIPQAPYDSKSETLFAVQPMSPEHLESMSSLQSLFRMLKQYEGLQEIVFRVLGGSPTDYLKLRDFVFYYHSNNNSNNYNSNSNIDTTKTNSNSNTTNTNHNDNSTTKPLSLFNEEDKMFPLRVKRYLSLVLIDTLHYYDAVLLENNSTDHTPHSTNDYNSRNNSKNNNTDNENVNDFDVNVNVNVSTTNNVVNEMYCSASPYPYNTNNTNTIIQEQKRLVALFRQRNILELPILEAYNLGYKLYYPDTPLASSRNSYSASLSPYYKNYHEYFDKQKSIFLFREGLRYTLYEKPHIRDTKNSDTNNKNNSTNTNNNIYKNTINADNSSDTTTSTMNTNTTTTDATKSKHQQPSSANIKNNSAIMVKKSVVCPVSAAVAVLVGERLTNARDVCVFLDRQFHNSTAPRRK